jgi:hypothetical protein
MTFNAEKISKLIKNSLQYTYTTKPNRLDGENLSLQEATTNLTKGGQNIKGRILIGVNGENQLIIEDGRHLLEAYRQLNKEIPDIKLTFSSEEAKTLFYNLIG